MRASHLMIPLLLLSLGCRPDDVAGGDDSGASDGADGTDGATDGSDGATAGSDGGDGGANPLEGAWRSEGEDLAPLFRNAFYDYQYVDVSFQADGSYTGFVETNDGETASIAGTYVLDATTTPGTISLTQTAPAEAGTLVSEGIWQVDGARLDYEIVLIEPNDYGCTAPTPTTGFGSSTCTGAAVREGDFWQIYRKQ